MNIYIGHLPVSTCGNDLRIMFTEFGKVQDAIVITDRSTRRSKTFGFVEMPSDVEADLAINSLNGRLVDGRNIKVDPAIQTDRDAISNFFRK